MTVGFMPRSWVGWWGRADGVRHEVGRGRVLLWSGRECGYPRKAERLPATSPGQSSTRKWVASSPRPAAACRPRAPYIEHVAVQSRQGAACAPQGEQRAFDLPLAAIGVVVGAVDGRPGAVVLADCLHRARVVEHATVGGHQLVRVATGCTSEAERAHVQIEERVRVAGDEALG